MARTGKKRPARSRKTSVIKRRRMLNGEEVLPIRAVGRIATNRYDIMGGYQKSNGFALKGKDGRPIPFRQIGELEWA